MVADWMYAVEAIAPSGDPMPAAAIERRLRAIVSDVESRHKRGERAVPMGVLTTDDRDRWADVRL